MTFDRLVSETGFSRNEVATHVAILTKKGKIGSEGGKNKAFFHHPSRRELVESLNTFMHGCANPIHRFGIGYIDPYSRTGKRYVDP